MQRRNATIRAPVTFSPLNNNNNNNPGRPVARYQKKHSPAHTHPGQRTSFITFLHLQRSTASSLFSLRA